MQFEEKNKTKIRKFLPLIIIGSVIVAILIGASVFAATVLYRDTIYNGITIGDVVVSGMTTEEAHNALADRYGNALVKTVTIRCEDAEETLDLIAMNAAIDPKQTAELAFSKGREGNLFDRLKEIFVIKKDGLSLPPTIYCDEAPLKDAVSKLCETLNTPAKETELAIGETELTITRGVPGLGIHLENAIKTFKDTVATLDGDVFLLNLEELTPKEPNAEAIFKEICGAPEDATYKIENNRLVVTPHKPGVSFDKAEAQAIIDAAEGDTIIIPIETTLPEITTESLNETLFPDMLGSFSSRYNAGDVSRSYNVSLAAQKINDIVLEPGDRFSYNGIVGPRTTARGFRVANVYVGNRVEPGVGGGICQVSSTLYNAVLYADLKIVTRTNHSLPVSYVPMGRDATVSYGSIDFIFENNTNFPVKIVAYATGGTNFVGVYGTKENKAKTIEIVTECIGTRAPKLVQKENPDLPEGTIEVEQAGANGSTYNSYKITKENGKVVKREFLAKSNYVASDRIEIIGTGPAEPVDGELTDVPGENPGTGETSSPENPDSQTPDEPAGPEDPDHPPIVIGPPSLE